MIGYVLLVLILSVVLGASTAHAILGHLGVDREHPIDIYITWSGIHIERPNGRAS